MVRRIFIEKFSKLLGLLYLLPSRIIASWSNVRIQDRFLEIKNLNNQVKKIQLIKIGNQNYISLEEFARVLHFGIYTNEAKKKTVLYLDNQRITFTADNTFVIVNNSVIQILFSCKWYNNSVAVHVFSFSKIISKYTPLKMDIDESYSELSLSKADVNISGLKISTKENGTMIHVYAEKKFDAKNILLDIRNNWFHIDIFGGKIDTTSISAIQGAGIISEIQGFQLGETASIALKLKGKILSKDIAFQQDGDDFYVNLRTRHIADNNTDTTNRELEEKKKKWYIDTIVLDAGHGGKDPGAVGYGKLKEKDIVLPIVLELGEIIKRNMPDTNVVFTRNRDVFIPLWQRTKIANEADGKLFISVHCNSSTNRNARGFETYFLSADKDSKATDVVLKENAVIEFEDSVDKQKYEGVNFILATMAQSAFIKQSQYLASLIQNSLRNKLEKSGMKSRGVKQGPFWVMVGATMPNVLVETGYISNKTESNLLKQKSTQQKIAQAIYEGINTYKQDIESVI